MLYDMESNEQIVTEPESQLFYDAFRASPIGIAL